MPTENDLLKNDLLKVEVVHTHHKSGVGVPRTIIKGFAWPKSKDGEMSARDFAMAVKRVARGREEFSTLKTSFQGMKAEANFEDLKLFGETPADLSKVLDGIDLNMFVAGLKRGEKVGQELWFFTVNGKRGLFVALVSRSFQNFAEEYPRRGFQWERRWVMGGSEPFYEWIESIPYNQN